MELGSDTGSEAETHLVGPVVFALRQFHQDGRHHAEIVQAGRAAVAHALPPGARVEAVQGCQASADAQHCHEGISHRIHVKYRQGRDHALPGFGQISNPSQSCIELRDFREIGIVEHTALGIARCAGCIQNRSFPGVSALGEMRGDGVLARRGKRSIHCNDICRDAARFDRIAERFDPARYRDDQRRFGMTDQVFKFAGAQIWIDRHHGGPQLVEREPDQKIVRPVFQKQGNAHALADTGPLQAAGKIVHAVHGRGVGYVARRDRIG